MKINRVVFGPEAMACFYSKVLKLSMDATLGIIHMGHKFTDFIIGLEEKIVSALKRANGLRNVLVHEYNGIIDEQAYESIIQLLPFLKEFESKVRRWAENFRK